MGKLYTVTLIFEMKVTAMAMTFDQEVAHDLHVPNIIYLSLYFDDLTVAEFTLPITN